MEESPALATGPQTRQVNVPAVAAVPVFRVSARGVARRTEDFAQIVFAKIIKVKLACPAGSIH